MPGGTPARVCVVMPALNEADALPAALAGRPDDVRVVVVDNGSTDGTADVARRLGVEVVTEARRGFGAACRRGLDAAVGSDVVVFMDADASLDWRDLDSVAGPVLTGSADLVLGRRVAERREPGAMPWHVAAANVVLGRLCGLLAGVAVADIGPYRAVRRDALLALDVRDRTYGWPLEMVLRAGRAGLRVGEVAVAYRVRAGTSKVTGRPWPTAKAAARMAWVLLRCAASTGWRPRAPIPVHATQGRIRPGWAAGFRRLGVRPRRPRTVQLATIGGLAAVVALVQLPMVLPQPVLGVDAVTQFVPWYSWLGDHLRAGRIPGWSPHLFAGSPGVGDPLSGWGYLPAMVLYTLLPPAAATAMYLLIHPLLASLGAYLLARSVGLRVVGAVVAGLTLALSGLMLTRNPCCFAYSAVTAWLPFALLGVEQAVAGVGWRGRLPGWSLTALALSQILAAWPGQGSLYAGALTLLWIGWRTAPTPAAVPAGRVRAAPGGRWRRRLAALALHGTTVGVLTVALGGAALLPRLEFNAVSTLAGGYPTGAEAPRPGGWTAGNLLLLVTPSLWYVGVVPLALAAAAPFVARRTRGPLFLAGVGVAAVMLALNLPALHLLVGAVPVVGRLHPLVPQRVLLVLGPVVALLAGWTVDSLRVRRRHGRALALAAVALVAVDLLGVHLVTAARLSAHPRGSQRQQRVDVAALDDPGPVGAFLQRRQAVGRYLSYDPAVGEDGLTRNAYSVRWTDPKVRALLANNRATSLGLETIQGYNPTHVARYDELIDAANGAWQNYHYSDVLPAGVDSPIIDLLNVRWIVVADEPTSAGIAGVRDLRRRLPAVFAAEGLIVLRNPDALPRAWLVHEARQVPAGTAARLLASGAVDPRRTALLEQPPPALRQPADPNADQAEVVTPDGDRLVVRTTSAAPALLLLSEVAYPAWRATVDGQPAAVRVADHALRAVAVPAGTHTVELRFAATAIRAGLAISGITAVLLLAALLPRRRHRARPPPAA